MDLHVAGILVRTQAGDVEAVSHRLGRIPGSCIHASTPDGKLVVTLEAADAETLSERLTGISRTTGVLFAALVYQHSEHLEVPDHGSP